MSPWNGNYNKWNHNYLYNIHISTTIVTIPYTHQHSNTHDIDIHISTTIVTICTCEFETWTKCRYCPAPPKICISTHAIPILMYVEDWDSAYASVDTWDANKLLYRGWAHWLEHSLSRPFFNGFRPTVGKGVGNNKTEKPFQFPFLFIIHNYRELVTGTKRKNWIMSGCFNGKV